MILNGKWKAFADTDGEGEKNNFYDPSFDDSSWLDINVPSHWQEHNSLRDYSGIVWFRRTFEYKKEGKKRIWLVFKGVFYKASVWLNGRFLGKNNGYFFPFKFDITNIISHNNVLAVKVESHNESDINAKKQVGGIFYHWDCRDPNFNPGGIWNSVEIVETDDIVIERIKIVTVNIEKRLIKVYLWINNFGAPAKATISINIRPKNFDGREYTVKREIDLKEGLNQHSIEILLDDGKLWWTWDLGFPHLYTATVEVTANDNKDIKSLTFGLRKVEIVKSGKSWIFYLNGKRIFLRGTNYGPTDQHLARVTKEMIFRDAKMMKEANINAVRIHAHVNPLAYDAFDELGILVWQDMPLQWMYDKSIVKDALLSAKKLVEISENHPSVAVYCCHNEPFKFPDKKDALKVFTSIIFGLLLSMLIGSISIKAGFISLPFNLVATISGLPYHNFVSYALSLFFMLVFFPSLSLIFSGPEALILILIASFLIPWDLIAFIVIFLALFRTSPILYVWNWNKNVLDKKICRVILNHDKKSRPIVRASGLFGWFVDGTDTHIYFGWYTGWLPPHRGFKHLKIIRWPFTRVLRLVSEFGAQSLPSLENLEKMLPKNLKPYLNKPLHEGYDLIAKYLSENHQYQPEFMRLWVNPKEFSSWIKFIDATQEWQAKLVKYYVEFLRSRKYKPTGGIFQFMFTDIAPLVTWSVVDYWRAPKKAYYTLMSSYQPILVVISNIRETYQRGKAYRFDLVLINDFHESFENCRLEILIGKNTAFRGNIKLEKDSITKFSVRIKIPTDIKEGDCFIIARLCTNTKCWENHYVVALK